MENNKVETLLMVLRNGNKPESDFWYVNIGYSNYMCGSKSIFSSLNGDFHSPMSFGDCSTGKVMGEDIKIKTKSGFIEMISNMLYVPDLKSNVLIAGQLEEKGYVVTVKNGACEIYNPNKRVIAVVKKKKTLIGCFR